MKRKFSKILGVGLALVLALSLSLVMAVPVAAAPLTAVSATPADATEGQTTTYEIGFTTATTYSVETVDIVFDTGFTGTAVLVEATGIGAGTLSDASLPSITYGVTAPAVIDTGTAITITFSGVVNPADGDYEVTVTTMDGLTTVDTGTADVTITPLPAEFEVVAGTNDTVTAGVAFSVEITALQDDLVTTETGYTGDHFIDFSWTGTGTIPDFELISFNAGVGTSLQTFILTDVTQTPAITATDNELAPPVTGDSEAITINIPALDYFVITDAPASVTAGDAFVSDVTVTAYDSLDNVKTDYTGEVSWTSTDPSAELPDADALVAGTCTFPMADFTLKTVLLEEGTPIDTTITVTGDGVSEAASITVEPAAASEITVTAAPTSIRADNINASTITATAYDEFGNVDTAFAETATFAVSLGALSNPDANFGSTTPGLALATLKSDGVVGTATVKVTPGTLTPYKTVTVTLVAPSLLAEVWVDATDGDNANSGTEAEPFASIQAAIAAAAEGGTVTVAGGMYTPQAGAPGNYTVIVVDKELTLQAAAGSTPVISPIRLGANSYRAIRIVANNVTIDGFTIVDTDPDQGTGADYGISVEGAWENFVIQNNTITGFTEDTNSIGIKAMNCHLTALTSGLIKDNTLEANRSAIQVANSEFVTIQGNLVQSNVYGIALFNSTDITVTENKVYSNSGEGIYVQAGSSGAFNRNDIADNTAGFICEGTVWIDAENNWWGKASGPTHVSNPLGEGDTVSDFVDFTPYLDAPYAAPVDPVAPVTTIALVAGWNLISLPLIPDAPAIETVLSGLDVNKVAAYSPFQDWKFYTPGVSSDLSEMNDGWGYWVDMNTAGTLTVSGYELCAPAPAVPPYYPVVEGWNLIGFKSTTGKTIENYLGPAIAGTGDTLEAIYGYNATSGVYFIPETDLEPGYGYWLAVNADGTIYP